MCLTVCDASPSVDVLWSRYIDRYMVGRMWICRALSLYAGKEKTELWVAQGHSFVFDTLCHLTLTALLCVIMALSSLMFVIVPTFAIDW